MKKLSFLIATALCIMACSGGSDEQPDGPGNGNGNGGGGSTPNPVSFSNPIVGKQLPDPTIIHAADGNFYLYVTQQDNIYIPIYKSTNMTVDLCWGSLSAKTELAAGHSLMGSGH